MTTASSIRERNLSQVLNLIHQAGTISRATITRQTGLSATTISALSSELMQSGFVSEIGTGESSGGRPPILLCFNYEYRYVIGIDMGATHVTAVLMNLNGRIISRRSGKHDVVNDPDGTIETIQQYIYQMLTETDLPFSRLLGGGITIPAPLTGVHLNQLTTIYMPRWAGYDLLGRLCQEYPFPFYIDNDANAGAIAEKWWGDGRNRTNFAYIKLGVGVGSGLIIHNQIYRGSGGTAGEIGHTTINIDGPICRCGNRGCMESYVGIHSVVSQVIQQKTNALPSWTAPIPFTIDQVIADALAGDPISRAVIRTTGTYLGIAIANLINLFNPELIILGGDLATAGTLLTDAVRISLEERTMFKAAREATIAISHLDQDAVAMGAATLAIQHALEPHQLNHTLTH